MTFRRHRAPTNQPLFSNRPRNHTRRASSLAVIAIASVSCSTSNDTTTPPVPTSPQTTNTQPTTTTPTPSDTTPPDTNPADTTNADTTPATTTRAETTTAPETTTARERVRRLPEELGPLVDVDYDDLPDALSQPGEFVEVFDNTLVYLPDSTDLDNLNNQRPPDEDLDIIAAYAGSTTAPSPPKTPSSPSPSNPTNAFKPPSSTAARHTAKAASSPATKKAPTSGTHGNDPTCIAPYVLTSPRTEDTAVVFDCKFTSTVLALRRRHPGDRLVRSVQQIRITGNTP